MEVLHHDFRMATPERSPNTSPLSLSPSPEQQHSPRGAHEQSLHIIVEPQVDGHTNFIHLLSHPTNQVLSSFIAEHGAHIEIQPGVFFRVPFPHESGYPYSTPQPHQFPPQNLYPAPTLNLPPNVIVQPHNGYNPTCPLHGSPRNNNAFQTGNERLDHRREKLQRKLREKNSVHNRCTCRVSYSPEQTCYQNGVSHQPPLVHMKHRDQCSHSNGPVMEDNCLSVDAIHGMFH